MGLRPDQCRHVLAGRRAGWHRWRRCGPEAVGDPDELVSGERWMGFLIVAHLVDGDRVSGILAPRDENVLLEAPVVGDRGGVSADGGVLDAVLVVPVQCRGPDGHDQRGAGALVFANGGARGLGGPGGLPAGVAVGEVGRLEHGCRVEYLACGAVVGVDEPAGAERLRERDRQADRPETASGAADTYARF